MIEQLDSVQHQCQPKRRFRCETDYEYSASSMAEFMSKLGQEPDRFEIITMFRNEKENYYEIFYKVFIE